MAVPLFILQRDLDARPFALRHCATQSDEQRFDLGEHNRGRSRSGKDGLNRLSVFGVHEANASGSCKLVQAVSDSNEWNYQRSVEALAPAHISSQFCPLSRAHVRVL